MQWYLKAPSLGRDDTLPYYFNPSIRSFHQQNQWHWQLTPDPDSSWTHRPLASFPCFEVQAFPHLPGWQAPPVPSNSEHCRRASACGIITTTAAAQSQTDQIQTDTQPNDPQKKNDALGHAERITRDDEEDDEEPSERDALCHILFDEWMEQCACSETALIVSREIGWIALWSVVLRWAGVEGLLIYTGFRLRSDWNAKPRMQYQLECQLRKAIIVIWHYLIYTFQLKGNYSINIERRKKKRWHTYIYMVRS